MLQLHVAAMKIYLFCRLRKEDANLLHSLIKDPPQEVKVNVCGSSPFLLLAATRYQLRSYKKFLVKLP